MDAREQLRRYLEQRRDAGESELVLDSLSVEDVMRMLGAGGGRGGDDRPRQAHAPAAMGGPTAASAPDGDWRAALRAAGAIAGAPGEGGGKPAEAGRSAAPPPPRRDLERAPAPTPPRHPFAVASDDATAMPDEIAPRAGEPASSAGEPASSAGEPAPSADEGAQSVTDVPQGGDAAGSPGVPVEAVPLEQIPTGIVVGSPAHELFGGEAPWKTLDAIAEAARTCQKCTLYKTARQAVPGEGDPHAGFVCVGEAPGANEDEQGRPFVGQAGQLLTKILAAIRLSREEVFICNVLKHRPPGNRNPTPDEVAACSPYLVRQIELLSPRVILALGTFAAQTLLQTREPIGKLRGQIHRYYGVPLIVTYHPAALLRNPSWKRPTWEDVQLARRLYDRARDA